MFAGRQRCPVCGCFETGNLCEECLAELKFEFEKRREGRLCRLCGKPLISEIEVCGECRENEAEIVPGRALFEYRGIGKEGIRAFKFKNERSLLFFFVHRNSLIHFGSLTNGLRFLFPETVKISVCAVGIPLPSSSKI